MLKFHLTEETDKLPRGGNKPLKYHIDIILLVLSN